MFTETAEHGEGDDEARGDGGCVAGGHVEAVPQQLVQEGAVVHHPDAQRQQHHRADLDTRILVKRELLKNMAILKYFYFCLLSYSKMKTEVFIFTHLDTFAFPPKASVPGHRGNSLTSHSCLHPALWSLPLIRKGRGGAAARA